MAGVEGAGRMGRGRWAGRWERHSLLLCDKDPDGGRLETKGARSITGPD